MSVDCDFLKMIVLEFYLQKLFVWSLEFRESCFMSLLGVISVHMLLRVLLFWSQAVMSYGLIF